MPVNGLVIAMAKNVTLLDDCDPSSWTIPDETSSENPGLLHESCTISMAKTAPPNTGGNNSS